MYPRPGKMLVVIVAPGLLSGVDRMQFARVGVLMRGRGSGWSLAGQQQCRDNRGRGQPGGDPEGGTECVSQGAGNVQVHPSRQRRYPLEVAMLAGYPSRDGALQEYGKQGRADGT